MIIVILVSLITFVASMYVGMRMIDKENEDELFEELKEPEETDDTEGPDEDRELYDRSFWC